MKAKILKRFVDKHTGALYKVGTVAEFTKARITEIQDKDASLIEVIKPAPKKKPAAEED